MRDRLIWLLSLLAGGCIAISVLWVMSSLIDVESAIPQVESDTQTVNLIRSPNHCNQMYTDANQALFNSRSCQTDDDCALVRDRHQVLGQCFASVQREKVDLVSAELKQFWACSSKSGSSICGHVSAIATCRESTCMVELLPRIGLEVLKEQTLTTINESLQVEEDWGGN
jgi:hypothetical protein